VNIYIPFKAQAFLVFVFLLFFECIFTAFKGLRLAGRGRMIPMAFLFLIKKRHEKVSSS